MADARIGSPRDVSSADFTQLLAELEALCVSHHHGSEMWRPRMFRVTSAAEAEGLVDLLRSCPELVVFDTLGAQLRELAVTRSPGRPLGPLELKRAVEGLLGGAAPLQYGVWVYYPWSKRLVHILDRAEFIELRTNRNHRTAGEVRRLHGVLRGTLGDAEAGAVARAAGTRTADYLLAHRIPRPVQRLLKVLPAPLPARVLLAALGRHAWTFAGSGQFNARCAWRQGPPVVLTIRGNPLCKGLAATMPACDYYAATFERLFHVLVQARSQVREVACEACGDPECRFEIDWRHG